MATASQHCDTYAYERNCDNNISSSLLVNHILFIILVEKCNIHMLKVQENKTWDQQLNCTYKLYIYKEIFT